MDWPWAEMALDSSASWKSDRLVISIRTFFIGSSCLWVTAGVSITSQLAEASNILTQRQVVADAKARILNILNRVLAQHA